MKDHYVYAHYLNGEIKYIGKGRKNRAWTFLQRSKLWNKTFADNKPEVKILYCGLSEIDAYAKEADEISKEIKKGSELINIAAGGMSGWDERSSKMLSEMRRGKIHYNFGKKRSEETRAKISETKQSNPEKSIARYWKGKKRDPELIKKLASAAHTPEANEKRRAKVKGRVQSEEERAMRREKCHKRSVICHETGKVYRSLVDAAKDMNCLPNVIGEVCRGKFKTYRGFTWNFV